MIPSITSIKWLAGIGLVAALAIGGYVKGHHDESMVFAKYQSDQKAQAAQQEAASQQRARQKEESAAQNIAAIQRTAQSQLDDHDQTSNATIAALRSGTLRLSSELANTRRAASVSQAATGPARTDDASTSELPVDTAAFLISESHRADTLAIHFNEAVAVIAQDRLTCDGSVP